VERGVVYRLLQVIPLEERMRRVHGSGGGVIYATYQRQFYVKLMPPSLFGGRGLGGAAAGYVRLVSAGWGVEGWLYAWLRVERLLVARAVYRAVPAARWGSARRWRSRLRRWRGRNSWRLR
jgi:hypothetical protein